MSKFGLDIIKEAFPGHTSEYKFGLNDDADTATETVWSGNGLYSFPGAAATMALSAAASADPPPSPAAIGICLVSWI